VGIAVEGGKYVAQALVSRDATRREPNVISGLETCFRRDQKSSAEESDGDGALLGNSSVHGKTL